MIKQAERETYAGKKEEQEEKEEEERYVEHL